ncbi:MAG: SGNH/GDSL hydrolase family protein [Actinomycetota bacterium]
MRSPTLRRTATALAGALALAGVGASPAAAHPRTVDVVNLGDSYSAAFGTGGRQEVPGIPGCVQGTGRDHVDELDAHPRVDVTLDAACAGATTDGIQEIASSTPVAAALRKAELVTLTLGGNDVGWSDVIGACSLQGSPEACDALVADAPRRIGEAAASAGETVAAIGGRTRGQVVVLGYPHLFSEDPGSPLVSPQRAAQLNDLTDELNAALEEAVEDGDTAAFVDVAPRFEGHAVDSGDPWIHYDPADPEDPHNLHPDERGYLSGYHAALEDELGCAHPGRR